MPVHRRFSPLLLILSSALATVVSLASPRLAIWVYFLMPLAPAIERTLRRVAKISPA